MKILLTLFLLAAPAWAVSGNGTSAQLNVAGTSADCAAPSPGKTAILQLGSGMFYSAANGAEIEISGTFVATWSVFGSTDGVTYRAAPGIINTNYSIANSTTVVANITVGGLYTRYICVFLGAYTSGIVNVTMEPRWNPPFSYVALAAQGAAGSSLLQAGTAVAMGVATISNNALLTVAVGDKAVVSQPAVTTQASASIAAGGATVRHIATSCTVSISTVAAQPDIAINLRDGATGAGTIIWTGRATCAIGTICAIISPPLNIVGTANTALTCETAAAPAIGNFATAALAYHDAT